MYWLMPDSMRSRTFGPSSPSSAVPKETSSGRRHVEPPGVLVALGAQAVGIAPARRAVRSRRRRWRAATMARSICSATKAAPCRSASMLTTSRAVSTS